MTRVVVYVPVNFIIWNHQGQNESYRDVSDETNDEGGEYRPRNGAARVLCLFASRSDDVKTNKRVEASRSSGKYLQCNPMGLESINLIKQHSIAHLRPQ